MKVKLNDEVEQNGKETLAGTLTKTYLLILLKPKLLQLYGGYVGLEWKGRIGAKRGRIQ